MTDFRALCAELLDALENAIGVIYGKGGTKHISTADAVITKADAALSQPEPQGPTGRPAVEPVPVSERLPGPEDCDGDGRCWWWDEDDDMWRLSEHRPCILCCTHWQPHWALPVPGVEGA